jgi:NAD(P)-dependent dehydrogenase (short-subunit alcohol dehydrogenase family)
MDVLRDVRAKRIVMTGATEGIGLAAARVLARARAALTFVARNRDKAAAVAAEIEDANEGRGERIDIVTADLLSQKDVRRAAAEIASRYTHVDILINNAGAMFTRRALTADGIERTWALNHLAPFLMTNLLIDRLRAAPAARIITTASDAHFRGGDIPFDDINAERGYRGFTRYGQSKLANILFTRELARRLAGTGVTANCYHPGLVATQFNRNNGALMDLVMRAAKFVSRTPEVGADTLVWLASSPDVATTSGGYFFDRGIGRSSAAAKNDETARRLWTLSERQVAGSAAAGNPLTL